MAGHAATSTKWRSHHQNRAKHRQCPSGKSGGSSRGGGSYEPSCRGTFNISKAYWTEEGAPSMASSLSHNHRM